MDSRLYTLTALPEKQSPSLMSMGHFCNPKFFFDFTAGFFSSGTSGIFWSGPGSLWWVLGWLHQSVSEEGLSHHIVYSMELLLTVLGILFTVAGTIIKAGMFIRGLNSYFPRIFQKILKGIARYRGREAKLTICNLKKNVSFFEHMHSKITKVQI